MINFEQDALRTASENMYTDRVDFFELRNHIKELVDLLALTDTYKKALFHGSRLESDEYNACTWPEHLKNNRDLIHGVLGVAAEAGELLESIQLGLFSNISQANMDEVNLKEEVGDVAWYLALLAKSSRNTSTPFTFEESLSAVVRKLKERYPIVFSTEGCLNRNVENERSVIA